MVFMVGQSSIKLEYILPENKKKEKVEENKDNKSKE